MSGLIPVLIAVLFIAKWERDKRVHSRTLDRAYQDGVKDTWRRVGDQALRDVERMAKEGLEDLREAFPVAIKVVAQRDAATDFNTGRVTAVCRTLTFTGLRFVIQIDPQAQYVNRLYSLGQDVGWIECEPHPAQAERTGGCASE